MMYRNSMIVSIMGCTSAQQNFFIKFANRMLGTIVVEKDYRKIQNNINNN